MPLLLVPTTAPSSAPARPPACLHCLLAIPPCCACCAAVLTATAVTGLAQAVVGGQPLMIVGVAEPIVLTYKFMYDFAKDQEGEL